MQNINLAPYTEYFIGDFEREHEEAITLIGVERAEDDIIEHSFGSHADSIRYHSISVVRHSFDVTGFVFRHPHGAIISAAFAKPVTAFEVTADQDGEEIDSNTFEDKLEKAILAKLGNIAALRDVNLI